MRPSKEGSEIGWVMKAVDEDLDSGRNELNGTGLCTPCNVEEHLS